ncbi:NAD(P)H-dependent amine dehydrogenase family protein [Enemella sp. A6]|uniref:NAD(P)H-dependent amine dehydrogenase family protein n=1 Tax=Enemella sp. A6 TaxID=3440152 RepID=UPI003EBB5BF2
MVHRVIWWGSGYVGKLGLAAVLDHPDFELVGMIAHTPEKIGKDAGEIVGRAGDTGVIATDDIDAVLALDADVVAYFANSAFREADAVADCARALRAGKHVISNCLPPLVYPPTAPKAFTEPLAAACAEGGRSMFVTGVEPGFFSDLLPLTLAGGCARVDSIKVTEVLDYSTFFNANFMDAQGWGGPMDVVPPAARPGALRTTWRGPIDAMAAGLGIELDDIEEYVERLPTDRAISMPGGLPDIEAGTMGALRWRLSGMVGGEPKIVIEHFNFMAADVVPDGWPTEEGYRVEIKGNPNINSWTGLTGPDGDGNTGGCVLSAWRGLAVVPYLDNLPPGLKSVLDFGLVPGRGNVFGDPGQPYSPIWLAEQGTAR